MSVARCDALQVLEITNTNVQAFIDLADLFLAESRQWFDDIVAAIDDRDVDAVTLSAQSLKCSLAIFRLEAAYEIAARVEQLARHAEWDLLREAVQELDSRCAKAESAVRRMRTKAVHSAPVK